MFYMFGIFIQEIFHASFPIEGYIKKCKAKPSSPDFTQSRTRSLVHCGQLTEGTTLIPK